MPKKTAIKKVAKKSIKKAVKKPVRKTPKKKKGTCKLCGNKEFALFPDNNNYCTLCGRIEVK